MQRGRLWHSPTTPPTSAVAFPIACRGLRNAPPVSGWVRRAATEGTVTIYFEDFTPGRVFEFGSVEVSEAEIIEFATRFDPQPMHIDPDAAKDSPFGGLIASGWHTCSLCMRLICDGLINDAAGLGSPGVEQIRWLVPVRAGDRLTARSTVEEARPSRSKPSQGTVTLLNEMFDQDGTVVMTMRALGMYLRRPT
jgi:acyl dehydratase